MLSPDKHLPIAEIMADIINSLQKSNELVLEAPPGAGKTTTVPLALMDAPWRKGNKILVLEPRRVAARAAAERMAQLLGEKVGETVGYTIRLERKVSKKTVIEVITEGVLTRRLQYDPELSDTALVIFDEFHERNIHSDLGLALCLQGRDVFREPENPLKLLVMSATLNGEAVSSLINNAPLIRSEGRSYPVDIFFGKNQPLGAPVTDNIVKTIEQALRAQAGNILVFLPGQKEINDCAKQLSSIVESSVAVLTLHGSIPLIEQQKAIAPLAKTSPYTRKIVLATDIAETSLTIEGVNIVVDSGLARKPQFDPRTGMTRLSTVRISRASSIQRAGRAGRLAPGVCYRLWSAEQQSQLLAHTPAEILEADLTPLVMQLLQWGVTEPSELQWLDSPPAAAFQQALTLLQQLGAVDHNTQALTPHGEAMAALPMEPRLAHMLVAGAQHGLKGKASNIAALLGDRNPLPGTDIETALSILAGDIICNQQHQGWLKRTRQQAKQYRQLVQQNVQAPTIEQNAQTGFLLACAFPDRIAKKRDNSRHQYLLSNGRSARLGEHDPLAGSEWLAIAELGGHSGQREDRIFSATRLSPVLFSRELREQKSQREIIEWQDEKLIAEKQSCIGKIILKRSPLKAISEQQRQDAIITLVQSLGIQTLPWDKDLRQWQARIILLHNAFPDAQPGWPDMRDKTLTESAHQWLSPFVNNISKRADLKRLDLKSILESLLPWPLPKQLNELAPERIQVPSGSHLSIDYSQSPPVLEVKLQEMFGCKTTPTIANGKIKLLVHLLSPARRPLQITQDLEGFWNTSYQDVKKEMKGRYPKHPWPDNPWDAEATKFTKRKKPPG
ncbi:ATP-dependent helicase HrpB [Teredinibacter haidensis]|uniref:ATP-dependent helicase HrpB n=1 Tax=Teredinibacter haidensis TaxID=2731755 RepID=UPI000948B47E|nr:ATP-dependent helicase HrpB [Teredinibacter haidensis]